MTDIEHFADFVYRHKESNYCMLYVKALKILGQEAKNQWTRLDVISAVIEADKKEEIDNTKYKV